jgi:hypothetical protein
MIRIKSDTARVNNKIVALDAPAQIKNDTTYVPLRFVGEALGIKVDYDSSTQTVNLSTYNVPDVPLEEIDLYASVQDVDDFGNLFRGRFNAKKEAVPDGIFSKVVIVHLKDITNYETRRGQILGFEYKNDKLYLKEKSGIFSSGSIVYMADSVNGLDRLRQDRESTPVNGVITSILTEAHADDYIKYPDFKNYKFNGNVDYFMIGSEYDDIVLAIPASEVLGE